MHPAGSASSRVDSRFKDRAENRRTDSRPIKTATCLFKKEIFNFGREVGDFDRVVKQAAIDERKFSKRIVQIWVAVGKWSVEHIEKQN